MFPLNMFGPYHCLKVRYYNTSVRIPCKDEFQISAFIIINYCFRMGVIHYKLLILKDVFLHMRCGLE